MKKLTWATVYALAIVSTLVLISQGREPQFFDNFGLVTFIFFAIIGLRIAMGKKVNKEFGLAVVLISVLGLLVDGMMVAEHFVK